MSYRVSGHDSRSHRQGPTDDVVKGLLVLGGIAFGLMLLKYLLEDHEEDDEE